MSTEPRTRRQTRIRTLRRRATAGGAAVMLAALGAVGLADHAAQDPTATTASASAASTSSATSKTTTTSDTSTATAPAVSGGQS